MYSVENITQSIANLESKDLSLSMQIGPQTSRHSNIRL